MDKRLVEKDLTDQNEEWSDGVKPQKKCWVNGKMYSAPADVDTKISPLMASIVTDSKKKLSSANVDIAFEDGKITENKKLDLDKM